MKEKTQKELLQELHQGVYGLKDTAEQGLLGSVKELVIQVKTQNDRIRKNERRIGKTWGVLIGVGAATGISISLVIRLLEFH